MIETSHDNIIHEIEKFEVKCKQEAQMKTLNLNDLIKISKHKLEKWNADLQVPDFDLDGNWKRITVRAREESEKLKLIISCFQVNINTHSFDYISKTIHYFRFKIDRMNY